LDIKRAQSHRKWFERGQEPWGGREGRPRARPGQAFRRGLTLSPAPGGYYVSGDPVRATERPSDDQFGLQVDSKTIEQI